MSTKWILLFLIAILVSCASHRKAANCSEIRYRLENMSYSEDQRHFIQMELDECEKDLAFAQKGDATQFGMIVNQVDSTILEGFTDSTQGEKSAQDSLTLE